MHFYHKIMFLRLYQATVTLTSSAGDGSDARSSSTGVCEESLDCLLLDIIL